LPLAKEPERSLQIFCLSLPKFYLKLSKQMRYAPSNSIDFLFGRSKEVSRALAYAIVFTHRRVTSLQGAHSPGEPVLLTSRQRWVMAHPARARRSAKGFISPEAAGAPIYSFLGCWYLRYLRAKVSLGLRHSPAGQAKGGEARRQATV